MEARFTYDSLNRLVGISYPDSIQNITYRYDEGAYGVGRLTRITDASGSTEFTYDIRGNTLSVGTTIGEQTYTYSYTYNAADRITGMLYPSGRSVTYAYDTSGRIQSVYSTDVDGMQTLADNIVRLPFGPSTSLTLGNGVERNRSFDKDYRVMNITDESLLQRGYAYNNVDNLSLIHI